MTRYLTTEEILFFHYRILAECQPGTGNYSILNPNNLLGSIDRPKQSAFGEDAYPDMYTKAAALTESLIGNHSFADGNKRVGITAGIIFMQLNNYIGDITSKDVYDAAFNASTGDWRYAELLDWFKRHYYKA